MMRTLTGRKRPVMFILDELAQLKHLPIVERAFTLGAGFGVQVWAVFQSVEQARKLYPLDSLYGSAGARCFFKVEDPETVEFASKCASGVLTPADVRHLPELGMLALLDGANPLIVERLGPQRA
jgi:type IV secretion system protein VirD4